jgi:hypothetical protein
VLLHEVAGDAFGKLGVVFDEQDFHGQEVGAPKVQSLPVA